MAWRCWNCRPKRTGRSGTADLKYAYHPIVLILLIVALAGCGGGGHYTPKPRGFHRLYFPEKQYRPYQAPCPFTFNYPVYAGMEPDNRAAGHHCWQDIVFPAFNARLHLSYYPITEQVRLDQLTEDARSFAFAHTVKATSIDEGYVHAPERRVYGAYYKIGGSTASAMQFYLTDSAKHYLRGALYLNEKPRPDSVQPVIDFLEADIDTLIRSLRWK